jgi:hypothetical protein
LGSGIAGNFKAVARSGATVRGGAALVGRRIPWVALGFITFDAFMLACAAGLLPGNICPRPDNPAPGGKAPDFQGGQCICVEYQVSFSYSRSAFPGQRVMSTGTAWGEIQRVTIEKGEGADDYIYFYCRGKKPQVCGVAGQRVLIGAVGLFPGEVTSNLTVDGVVRIDGTVDNCGNPPPVPQPRQMPDIYNSLNIHRGNINFNIYILKLGAPSPMPKKAPNIQSPPSPLPGIYISNAESNFGDDLGDMDLNLDYRFNPGGGGNYQDFPDIFNNFPPSPQPQTKDPNPVVLIQNPPASTPGLNNPPAPPPPIPDELPDDATESDKYQFRQNREAIDKLYKLNAEVLDIQKSLAKQNQILENLQKLLDFEVEGSQIIKRCDDIEFVYSYKEKILPAINRQLSHVKSIEQIILDEVCEIENAAVVASPEWWQVRIQGDIPQIVLIFRFLTTRTYHKLVVPHPLNSEKLVNAPIKTYKKGNWQGEIVNIDNTKFLCNCGTKEEASRLLDIAASLIDPLFLGDPIRKYYAERKGQEVSPGDMLATSAMYFPTGQRSMRPEWRVAFTKDAQ